MPIYNDKNQWNTLTAEQRGWVTRYIEALTVSKLSKVSNRIEAWPHIWDYMRGETLRIDNIGSKIESYFISHPDSSILAEGKLEKKISSDALTQELALIENYVGRPKPISPDPDTPRKPRGRKKRLEEILEKNDEKNIPAQR